MPLDATKTETVLTNATVVTRDTAFPGTVVVRDGVIAEVAEGASALPGAVDCGGDLLLPGLIEMHTDNMEKHFEPRPGVLWPNPLAAVMSHDTQVIGAGITTVFDAISVGDYDKKGIRRHILTECVAAVKHAARADMLRADHLFHMRCEISDDCVVEMFEPFAGDPLVQLVSVMDHTPGQRQWHDVGKFVQYYKGESWSEEELARILDDKRAKQAANSHKNRQTIVGLCRDKGLALASHDDANEAHVLESLADGAVIAEFPLTEEAARVARDNGLGTIMGAPNVVRGGSHSGNIAAIELARLGLLSGLSSDYVPASLLQAVFILERETEMGLAAAVATVSSNVADMLGMDDRGRIEVGRRADLLRVRVTDHAPVVREVLRGGVRVY
jgi:alpha-D-ribose 1-methylphosphonate 5-triphosphate diphosphatase